MRTRLLEYYGAAALQAAALACLLLAALSLIVLSGSVLDSIGYHYDVEGGSALEKIHPATLLVLASLALRVLADQDVPGAIQRIFLSDRHLLVATAGFVALEIYVVTCLKTPATPPLDSYFLPIFFCFALRGLNTRWVRVLAVSLVVIFVANAIFAYYERATGTRLFFVIPDDITGHPEDTLTKFDWKGHLRWDWRSSALLGHPLSNAMITGCFMLILQATAARWIPAMLRVAIIALQAGAMITFGGRVALVLVILISAVWWVTRAALAMLAGQRLRPHHIAAACLTLPPLFVGFAFALDKGLLDKNIERFTDDDGSAQARVTMWRIFDPISWHDIFLGPDPDVVATHQRLQGLELGIESFWAGLPLAYGIIMSAIIITCWILLCVYLAKATNREAYIVSIFYFLVGSASAGLASKTTSLGILVLLVTVLMSRKLTSGAPARAAGAPGAAAGSPSAEPIPS